MSERLTLLSCFRPMEAVHPTTPEQIQKYRADNGNINTKHHKIRANIQNLQRFQFRRLKL